MNSKELVLKRLLEEKHISVEEMFLLNKKEGLLPTTVIIKDSNSCPFWKQPCSLNPYWYSININNVEVENILHSDYKMD